MNGRQYEQPGSFGRAVEAALAADAKREREPLPPLCRVDGCALPAGHVERAGSEHQPQPWVVPLMSATTRPVRDRARIDAAKARCEELRSQKEEAEAECDVQAVVIAEQLAMSGSQPTEDALQRFRDASALVRHLRVEYWTAVQEYSAAVNGRPA